MSGHKAPRRVDTTHVAIRDAFRRLGWLVVSTAGLGGGFPDLLIAKGGVMRQIEVKDGAKPPSARRLTPEEVAYHRDLAAAGCPVLIVESVQQVLDVARTLSEAR